MMHTTPLVGIVLLNWNRKDDTLACLHSLRQIENAKYQVFLVDNASTDGLVDIIPAQFPDVTLIQNTSNLGFAEGNNVGIRAALAQHCDYVLLLNNDTLVESGFLARLVAIGEKYPFIGMLSPIIYWHTPPEKVWFYGGAINWRNGGAANKVISGPLNPTTLPEYTQETDFLSGCALLVKTSVIQKIGLLDARFFAYYEDVDWCLRCQQAEWDLAIVPSAVIWHKVSASTPLAYNQYLCYRNAILFLWKHSSFGQFLLRVKRHVYHALAEFSWDRETYFGATPITRLDGIWAGLTGKYGKTYEPMPPWARTGVYRYIRYLLWLLRYPE